MPSRVARRPWLGLTFEVKLALLVLGLSLLYAVTFSQLVYVSLMEQVIAPDLHPPRYAYPPHFHSAAEWVLLLGPAGLGWAGVVGSLAYLGRRALWGGRSGAR